MLNKPIERFDGVSRWPPWTYYHSVTRYQWAIKTLARDPGVVNILDAACGSGYGSELLGEGVAGCSVTALDVDENAVRLLAHRRPDIRALVGDVTQLPLGDASVDAYLCFETIEHVLDSNKVVSEARRVIRPGGYFIVSSPNRRLSSPGPRKLPPVNPFHVDEFELDEFIIMLESHFSSVLVLGQSPETDTYVSLLNAIASRDRRIAVRIRQLSRLVRAPWQKHRYHMPRDITPDRAPAVFFAVCRP